MAKAPLTLRGIFLIALYKQAIKQYRDLFLFVWV